jgi:hypothetical protein
LDTPQDAPTHIPLAIRTRSWVHIFDLRCTDVFITFCSFWVAAQLWFWPIEFSQEGEPFSTAIEVRGNERTWALFCAMAALLKLTGLVLRHIWRSPLSDGLLTAGFFMSVVFWGIVTAADLADAPHSIVTTVVFALTVAAGWQMVQPQTPSEDTP